MSNIDITALLDGLNLSDDYARDQINAIRDHLDARDTKVEALTVCGEIREHVLGSALARIEAIEQRLDMLAAIIDTIPAAIATLSNICTAQDRDLKTLGAAIDEIRT